MKSSISKRTQFISGALVMVCFVGAMACNQQTPADESTEAAIEASEDIQDLDIEYDAEFARDMAENALLEIQLQNWHRPKPHQKK